MQLAVTTKQKGTKMANRNDLAVKAEVVLMRHMALTYRKLWDEVAVDVAAVAVASKLTQQEVWTTLVQDIGLAGDWTMVGGVAVAAVSNALVVRQPSAKAW